MAQAPSQTGFYRQDVENDHALVCDGVPLTAMAAAEGTPLYVYSAAVIRERYRAIDAAFDGYPHAIHYALKANSSLAVVRLLQSLGSHADANSLGEVDVAMCCGFRPDQIVFTGVGKSAAEIDRAVRSASKRSTSNRQASSRGSSDRRRRTVRVAASASTRTSTRRAIPYFDRAEITFGVPPRRCPRVGGNAGAPPASGWWRFTCTSGRRLPRSTRCARRRRALTSASSSSGGLRPRYVDLGGGLGVSSVAEVPSAADYVCARHRGPPDLLPIVLEPGRAVAAPAGALVARVIDVKARTASSDFVIIDAGMTEAIRPALYSAFHRIEPVSGRQPAIVTTRSWTSLRKQRRRRARSAAATLAAATSSPSAMPARGSVMASNYNRRPRRPRCWSTAAPGASSAAGKRWTTSFAGDVTEGMPGHLIAFEGLDQSGKQTQAVLLRDRLKEDGRKARLVSFPDYATSIGEEIARALAGEREYGADVMQLLYVANRYERKPDLERWLEGGLVLVCDRYTASSVAYGEAIGL